MKDRDLKLNQKLVDACANLSSYTDSPDFIEPVEYNSYLKNYKQLMIDANNRSRKFMYSIGMVSKTLKSNIEQFQDLYEHFPQTMASHNDQIAQRKSVEVGKRINPVEGRDLDKQQLTAIAYDVRSRLVIAGAGTGKTTTIIGLVKDLLLSGAAKPEEILLLSFTNASVRELNERIQKETGQRIETTTFHRLGLKIIAESQGKVPSISTKDVGTFIGEEILRRRSDPVFLRKLNEYIAYDYDSLRDESQFESGSELIAYLQENPLITMNGERVKSFGESDIANYLALNGIPYVYEDSYEFPTADSEYGQYHPDFHIKGTNIYIEYFGIDRNGHVAKFMTDRNPEAAEEYKNGMEWKRGIHRANGTRLIELYAYNRSEGELTDELERKLKAHHVKMEPCPPEVIFDRTFGEDQWKLKALTSKFTTAILLIKGYGKPWEEVYPKANDHHSKRELKRLEQVLRPIYEAYQSELSSRGEIDFEDMLNLASTNIWQGKYVHPYRYVIVDEYQDLSRSRYNLLRSMRRSNDFRLFCVGDDWQSIYRFNGCDVSYILDFEKYWGPSAICKIETTYRFSGELLRKSSEFISRNGKQYRKHLVGVSSRESKVLPLFAPTEHEIRHRISNILDSVPEGKSVLFLGRYNHDVRILSEDGFSWKPNISDSSSNIKYSRRPDLDMKFMTIHSSKGLQADIVFSLNNKTGRYGFPSKRDEPVLIPLLLGNDNNQYDEERRLFYVAMTRAKDAAYIVSVTHHQSDFFKEMFPIRDGEGNKVQMVCPICGGAMIIKTGKFGMFYGCSNYGSRGCRFTRQFEGFKE